MDSLEEIVQIFIGNIIHCLEPFVIHTVEKGFVLVKNQKVIAIDNVSLLEDTKVKYGIKDDVLITILTESQLLVPGLIDTHIHAPQYPNAGLGYDQQLLDWLNTYTFPLEERFKEIEFAEKVYNAVVKRTLAHGTTTACYFATMHLHSSLSLCDVVLNSGQRAFVGKVNMNHSTPVGLTETTEESLENTEIFIKDVLGWQNQLVQPIITPRFALCCDMELMKNLGVLAKKYDVHIQSHISENKEEIEAVLNQFKSYKSYAEVYDAADLLTPKTILAHGVHLQDNEMKLLAKRNTSIAHCPASNTCLMSGVCDVRKLIHEGVNVGLGTDVAGGPSPSIIEAMRCALSVSAHIHFNKNIHQPLNCYDVFYLATLGGAKALHIEDRVGNFDVGKDFDALIIDMKTEDSGVDLLQECKPLQLLQKFIYLGDDRNVAKVFVAGKQVK